MLLYKHCIIATFFSAGEEVLFPFHGDWNTVVLKSASLLALTPLKCATPRSYVAQLINTKRTNRYSIAIKHLKRRPFPIISFFSQSSAHDWESWNKVFYYSWSNKGRFKKRCVCKLVMHNAFFSSKLVLAYTKRYNKWSTRFVTLFIWVPS